MATKLELYINLLQANARASELERLASTLKTLSNTKLQQDLAQLSQEWTGSASREYIAQGKRLHTAILAEVRNLTAEAQTIRTIAKRTYDTEMRALEMANNRTYH